MPARPPRPDADLRTILDLGAIANLDDGTLLDLFERRPEHLAAEHAFEALVARHGALVLRVARLRLDSEEDARDAFQATFWLLARRSRSIRNRDALAGWLFAVAGRVATRARADAARRRAHERRAAVPVLDATSDPARREPDLAPNLVTEINRLPTPYRLAVVLADLEGLTSDEAAARLGCPVGTFKARLSRARARLRSRLAARGLAPDHWQVPRPAPSVVPFPLALAARRLALAAPPAGRAAVASAVTLARGASRTMFIGSITTWAAAATLALAVAASSLDEASQEATPRLAPGYANQPAAEQAAPAQSAPSLARAFDQVGTIAESLADPDQRARMVYVTGILRQSSGDRMGAGAAFRRALAIAEGQSGDREGFSARLMCEIAEAQASNGDKETARRTFDRITELIPVFPPEDRYQLWMRLLATERRVGSRDFSRATVDGFRRFLEGERERSVWTPVITARGMSCDLYGFYPAAHLVAARASAGDFTGALQEIDTTAAFHQADRPDVRYQALIGVAQALRPEDGPQIPIVLDRVRQALFAVPPSDRLSEALLVLMDVEIDLGFLDEAATTANRIKSREAENNSIPQSLAREWMALASAQRDQGERAAIGPALREASAIVRGPVQERFRPDLLLKLALAAAQMGDLDFALGLINSLGDRDRYRALERLVREMPVGDRVEERRARDRVGSAIEQAIDSARAVEPDPERGTLPNWVILRAGTSAAPADLAAARAMVTAASPGRQQHLLEKLASAEASVENFAAALVTAGRLDDPSARGWALLNVIEVEIHRQAPGRGLRWHF